MNVSKVIILSGKKNWAYFALLFFLCRLRDKQLIRNTGMKLSQTVLIEVNVRNFKAD
jgi:hypothetical protein